MNNDLLMTILTASITIFGILLTRVLIPYFKAKTSKETQEDVLLWLEEVSVLFNILVNGVEEYYKNSPKAGEKKHEMVKELVKQRYDMSDEEIDVLIKAFVKEMNDAKDLLEY